MSLLWQCIFDNKEKDKTAFSLSFVHAVVAQQAALGWRQQCPSTRMTGARFPTASSSLLFFPSCICLSQLGVHAPAVHEM